ncbi:hypothetical protein [Collimonas sp. OK607]|uniref:hypothetical protein n=1 Tax=Collimonas sp. OK607 TaxID=1798194 RepID=UPI00147F0367|nr:hypothetical protein [Collimonas sp. OK607]
MSALRMMVSIWVVNVSARWFRQAIAELMHGLILWQITQILALLQRRAESIHIDASR